jgi:hypothetical protein
VGTLDARSRNLAGDPSWVRSNVEIFTHSSTMTAHDWLVIMSDAGEYILHGVFDTHKNDALLALLAATGACLKATCAVDSDQRDDIDRLKLQVVEACCLCEAVLPATELSVLFHILIHVPDTIHRWNNVRNYWCFFGERYPTAHISTHIHTSMYIWVPPCTFGYPHNTNCYFRCMGYFVRFIHNRDLATENIMTAATRTRLVLDCPPGVVKSLLVRLKESGMVLPAQSMLKLADEVPFAYLTAPNEFSMYPLILVYSQGADKSKAGDYLVSIVPTKKNHQIQDLGNTSRLQTITSICRSSPLLFVPSSPEATLVMIKGVNINGTSSPPMRTNAYQCVPHRT